jgi:hypothetical protein
MRLGLAATLAICATIALAQQGAPAPSPYSAGAAVGAQLRASLATLAASMSSLDPNQLHLPATERRALAQSQSSVGENLSEAVPGLLDAFIVAPGNLGAAFRLYRDVDALLAVSQRSAEMLPRKDAEAARPLATAVTAVHRDLDALGNYIESSGQAEYTRLRQLPRQPSAAGPPPAPKTLIIGNANGKPAPKKKIPH